MSNDLLDTIRATVTKDEAIAYLIARSNKQSAIIADLTAHLHDAIAILGWSKPDWQRTIERAKREV